MASPASAKSQPLHYFSLPQLKWKKNHHGGRTRISSPHQSPPPDSQRRQSPILDSASESDSGNALPIKNDFTASQSEMKSDGDVTLCKERKSKIYIRLPNKKKSDDVEGDESVAKTWNLRPRRQLHKQSNKIGVSEHKSQPQLNHNRTEMEVVNNNISVEQRGEKKHKFSISLCRREIEEDIFALTGSKPSRRPKKRPRALQKQLDNIFPGLWLGWITRETYKVSDAPPKI